MDVMNEKRVKCRSQAVLENFQGMKMMEILNSHHQYVSVLREAPISTPILGGSVDSEPPWAVKTRRSLGFMWKGGNRLFQMGRLGNKNAVLPVERCGCSVVCAVTKEFLHREFKSWKWWNLERYGHLAYRCGVMMDDNNLKPNSKIMFVNCGMVWSQLELSNSIFLFLLNVSCYILP